MTDQTQGRGGHDIDPNATLERMVELARVVQHTVHATPTPTQDASWDLAEHVIDMHDWLSKGGFLPADWFGERREQGTRCPEHRVPFQKVNMAPAADRWLCPYGCIMTVWTGKNGHADLLKQPENTGPLASTEQDDERPLKDASMICGHMTNGEPCWLDRGHEGRHAP